MGAKSNKDKAKVKKVKRKSKAKVRAISTLVPAIGVDFRVKSVIMFFSVIIVVLSAVTYFACYRKFDEIDRMVVYLDRVTLNY